MNRCSQVPWAGINPILEFPKKSSRRWHWELNVELQLREASGGQLTPPDAGPLQLQALSLRSTHTHHGFRCEHLRVCRLSR